LWLRPLWCSGEYTYDCKLKKFREILLTTLEHNQHDVIDVIWRLPVWNVYIRRCGEKGEIVIFLTQKCSICGEKGDIVIFLTVKCSICGEKREFVICHDLLEEKHLTARNMTKISPFSPQIEHFTVRHMTNSPFSPQIEHFWVRNITISPFSPQIEHFTVRNITISPFSPQIEHFTVRNITIYYIDRCELWWILYVIFTTMHKDN
jgi:hypothetical protein